MIINTREQNSDLLMDKLDRITEEISGLNRTLRFLYLLFATMAREDGIDIIGETAGNEVVYSDLDGVILTRDTNERTKEE